MSFFGEVEEGAGSVGVMRNKVVVEIGKAQEGTVIFDCGRGQPFSNASYFDWVHG